MENRFARFNTHELKALEYSLSNAPVAGYDGELYIKTILVEVKTELQSREPVEPINYPPGAIVELLKPVEKELKKLNGIKPGIYGSVPQCAVRLEPRTRQTVVTRTVDENFNA